MPGARRAPAMGLARASQDAPNQDPGGWVARRPARCPITRWNETQLDFAGDKTIHGLFEEQVRRTPDAVALIHEDQEVTYRELDRRAEVVAGELRRLGIGPDVPVGFCAGRSPGMMAGLLGILKAGGCYVPLDPTYPKDRLAYMLEDSRAPVLLTQNRFRDELALQLPKLKVVCLESLSGPGDPPADDRKTVPEPRNLAYVIYTSGSTGQPKGVMISHRNVLNFFAAMDRVLGTEPGVWLAVTSISFDISVLELFWTLARGFKVVIHSDERDASGPNNVKAGQRRSLPELVVRQGVSHLQCTPSLAGTLLLAPESHLALRRLGKLLLGGEALPVSLAQRLLPLVPGLLNLYGPTETTIWSACHPVVEAGSSVPIGRPLANTQIYILDRNLEPVPAGVPGEIFIGGEGVARGYLNRPELTAERFIRNPFSADPEARIYRTGDRGRWRADGTIEFLGRTDFQVKIRGHRIELGEIESALGQHPGVREVVAMAREDSPGDQRLVAYVVAHRETKPTAGELRQFAKSRLPGAMVPSAFVLLDALPLTPNGKVNRKALPAPSNERPALDTEYQAPSRGLEQDLSNIWREVLHVGKAGLHDNFFDLGGHSLLVAEMQARVQALLGRDVPMVKLFQYPTISSLAGFLGGNDEATPAQGFHDRGLRKQSVSRAQRKRAAATIS